MLSVENLMQKSDKKCVDTLYVYSILTVRFLLSKFLKNSIEPIKHRNSYFKMQFTSSTPKAGLDPFLSYTLKNKPLPPCCSTPSLFSLVKETVHKN